jgi:hypothetical protein
MAQTKRKRRTKHRGTAAGTIEARGRTGRKPEPGEKRPTKGSPAAQRAGKAAVPPSWKAAAGKAAFGALMLLVLVKLGVLGKAADTKSAITLCVFAAVLYTPVMYATDRFIYQRKVRAGTAAPPRKKP